VDREGNGYYLPIALDVGKKMKLEVQVLAEGGMEKALHPPEEGRGHSAPLRGRNAVRQQRIETLRYLERGDHVHPLEEEGKGGTIIARREGKKKISSHFWAGD